VSQFKTVWLSLLFTGLMPLAVMAEGEDIPADAEIGSDANYSMLRQTNTVRGYQPLTVAGQQIESAYLEETLGERHGAIVLLHDEGEQFESQGVVTPLRHSLPEYGWSTLTLAFDYPYEAKILLSNDEALDTDLLELDADELVAENEVESKQAEAGMDKDNTLPAISNQDRIQAALAFLQAKDVKRIIFIGHGAGGNMAIELLDTIKTPISALILVGATALPESDVFDEFNFPILDVYGANDLNEVPIAIEHRKMVMKRINNTAYEVRRIVGADHVFLGLTPTLTATVSGWLRSKFVEQADN